MKNFTLHLFDLDDTLINTANSYLLAYHKLLQNIFVNTSISPPSFQKIDIFCRFFGSGKPEVVLPNLFSYYHYKYKKDLKDLVAMFWEEFWSNLQVFPNAVEYLFLLQQYQKKLAIVSNGDFQKQKQKIQNADLQHFFTTDSLFISSDFEKFEAKPASFMLELAMKRNSVSPECTIFYGNSDSDILAGKLAKVSMAVLKIAPPINRNLVLQADYYCNDWKQVLRLF